MRTAKTLNWLIALTGAWEIVSPFILGYSFINFALWNAVIVGVLLLVLGIWADLSVNVQTSRGLDWIVAILGAWLIVSPFVLAYSVISNTAMTNAVIVGVVALMLGIWAAVENSRGYLASINTFNQYNRGYYGRGRDFNGPDYNNPRYGNQGVAGRGSDYGYDRDYGYTQEFPTDRDRFYQDRHSTGPFYGVGPQGYHRSDERILEDVIDRLTFNGMVDASNVNVKVENGVVTLDGTVPSRQDRRIAGDLADNVMGVQDVHNDLHIRRSQDLTNASDEVKKP